MTARIQAIVPKRQITSAGLQDRVKQWFREVGNDFKKEMQVEPPSKSNTYTRTHTYQRGWKSARVRVRANSVIVMNDVNYARFVGGPKYRGQTRRNRRAGWRSTTDVVPLVVTRHRQKLDTIILPYRNVTSLP